MGCRIFSAGQRYFPVHSMILAQHMANSTNRQIHHPCAKPFFRQCAMKLAALVQQLRPYIQKKLTGKCCSRPLRGSLRWGSVRLSELISCGLCFSQVMPFLCELMPCTAKYELNWRRFPARRRACSPLHRVARVSRLIGNSDTTRKASGWQVGSRHQGFGIREQGILGRENRRK